MHDGPSPRHRRPARVLLGVLVGAAGLLFGSAGAAPRAPAVPTESVSAAESRLDDAVGAEEAARRRLSDLETSSAEVRAEYETLTARQTELATSVETVLSNARELAVAAYVNGGRSEELHNVLSSPTPSEAAWVRVVATGGVDQAADAAEELARLQAEVDEQVVQLADEAADAVAAVDAARVDVERAVDAVGAARVAVVEARESEAAAARVVEMRARHEPPAGDGWAELRRCESGGNYQAVSPNGRYRGAYQFDRGTWQAMGGTGDPAAAPPYEQDARARALYALRGSAPWPHCGRFLNG